MNNLREGSSFGGSRASLAINGELASRLLSGGQLTTVRGLLASSPVASITFLGVIRVNSFPSYPSRASRLSPALALLASSVLPTKPSESLSRRQTQSASPHYHAPLVSGVFEFHNGVKLWALEPTCITGTGNLNQRTLKKPTVSS